MNKALFTGTMILLAATMATATAPTPEQQAKYGNCISHAYAGGNLASAHLDEVFRIVREQNISFDEAQEIYKNSDLYKKVVQPLGDIVVDKCVEYANSDTY